MSMTLKVYHQKRNFKKTPEPKGHHTKSKKTQNLYVIQKHAASHLHYDLRLELNGVLLSWAVPKGPSLDPTVKRLAVHVEDHPVEYGSFEGIIPKGQYGGGTVMLWDTGEWISEDANPAEAYRKKHLTFQLKGKKLKGKWKLIQINKNDKTWLLMKLKDRYAKPEKEYSITLKKPNSVLSHQSIDEISDNYENIWGKKGLEKKGRVKKKIKIDLPARSFPNIIHPQLATLVDEPPEGDHWLHEIKFDGYRLLIFKKGKKVTVYTRHHHDWTNKFKEIAAAISQLPVTNLILDGEVVVLDKDGHSNFQLLQNSIKENKAEFIYTVFDLLYYDRYNLMNLRLIERKTILQKLLSGQKNKVLHYSDHVKGSGKTIFKKSCKLGLEGIISKKADSTYNQKRDKSWLKVKCIQRQEFVIAGFLKSERRKYFKSLMLGTFNKQNELIYHGNVGTGFTEASLKMIHTLISKQITDKMPFKEKPAGSHDATWLKPVIIGEVEFTEWTDAGTLRHPSFKGIRSDKPAKEIKKEIPYRLTHPTKLIYPEDKITKQALADYYESIQQWILPYICNRPLSLVRCPATYHSCFYQKHLETHHPSGLFDIKIKDKSGVDKYIYLKDIEGLMALAQMSVLEIHSWGANIQQIEKPDTLILDIDPAPSVHWRKVVKAAFDIKEILTGLKLKCFVKTTGGKGLHVVTPIIPEHGWLDIKEFAHSLVNYLVQENPAIYIATISKVKRQNKIFIDYLRNQKGATSIAPYSTRARKEAPVATPIDWDELTHDIRDTFFTIKTLPKRLDTLKKDPWKDFFKTKQKLKIK